MAHKTITISEEAYNLLVKEKRENESFTNVILRLFQRPKLSSLSVKWQGSDDEVEEIYSEIINERNKGKLREIDL